MSLTSEYSGRKNLKIQKSTFLTTFAGSTNIKHVIEKIANQVTRKEAGRFRNQKLSVFTRLVDDHRFFKSDYFKK